MFEYDEAKSKANKEKHGIDFEEAQSLWNDKKHLIFDSVYVNEELRHLLIGHIENICYVAVFTIRGDNKRIISVRRCRKNEKDTL